jgi:hypothetical protein
VNTNGVLSFGEPFPSFQAQPFPTEGNESLIAPLWSDINTNVAGDIYYRFTDDPALLSDVSRGIENAFGDPFMPELLFIATWINVAAFGRSPDEVRSNVPDFAIGCHS